MPRNLRKSRRPISRRKTRYEAADRADAAPGGWWRYCDVLWGSRELQSGAVAAGTGPRWTERTTSEEIVADRQAVSAKVCGAHHI